MDFEVLRFFADYAISAVDPAPALEDRGFKPLWASEHLHTPAPRKTSFRGGSVA
jgi:hypothetical protein